MLISKSDLEDLPEYDNHERVVKIEDPGAGLVGFIAIHRRRGENPSLGATRFWKYEDEEDALRDALRLSRLMSYKSAMAGLPYGGAKAVIMRTRKSIFRRSKLFKAYAEKVNELEGRFVTGSDVGVGQNDLQIMSKYSPHIIGTNVKSGYYTALGVLLAVKEVLRKIYGSSDIGSRNFAIQGLGKTGFALLGLLYPEASKIFVSDIDNRAVDSAVSKFPNIVVVDSRDIHKQEVDIFCPCALSRVVNQKTLDNFKCKGIAGAANNQLSSEEMGTALYDKKIVYAPDYVTNSGGIISVVDQFMNGEESDERIKKELMNIKKALESIFYESNESGLPSNMVADAMARKIFN